jgi:hypothetical protein
MKNRRSAAHGCLRFAYSFVSLTLRQYYLYCDSCAANRRSAVNKQKSAKNNLLALRMCLASPYRAAKAPRFAFKLREQRSANNNTI